MASRSAAASPRRSARAAARTASTRGQCSAAVTSERRRTRRARTSFGQRAASRARRTRDTEPAAWRHGRCAGSALRTATIGFVPLSKVSSRSPPGRSTRWISASASRHGAAARQVVERGERQHGVVGAVLRRQGAHVGLGRPQPRMPARCRRDRQRRDVDPVDLGTRARASAGRHAVRHGLVPEIRLQHARDAPALEPLVHQAPVHGVRVPAPERPVRIRPEDLVPVGTPLAGWQPHRGEPNAAGCAGTGGRTPRSARTPAPPPRRRSTGPWARPPSPRSSAADCAPGRTR